MKFDTVVANPPFSLDKWGKVDDKDKEENKATNSFDPATDKYNRFWRGIPPKSKGDWAFISHMIETAYEGHGKVGCCCSSRCFVPWKQRRKDKTKNY